MSMTQQEWAARVAAIGKLAGWDDAQTQDLLAGYQWDALVFLILVTPLPQDHPVIAAIRQLAADWLASEGVVAVRVCRRGGPCDVPWAQIEDALTEEQQTHCPRCGGKIEVTP